MKNLHYLFISTIVVFSVFSCSKFIERTNVDSKSLESTNEITAQEFKALSIQKRGSIVSVAESKNKVLTYLKNFISYSPSTKRNEIPLIETIWVKFNKLSSLTKVNNQSFTVDSIPVYIFSNQDREGYTVISGDRRLPYVFAHSSNGEFSSSSNPGTTIFYKLLPYFIEKEINKYELIHDSLYKSAIAKISNKLKISTKSPVLDPNMLYYTEETYSDWVDSRNIGPLVSTKWGQEYPYNQLLDTIYCSGLYVKPHTGCVAVAISQLFAYHKYPSSFQNYSFNWVDMTSSPYANNLTLTFQNQIASLMKVVGSAVNMNYTCASSGSTILYAYNGLSVFGYTSDNYCNYNLSSIIESLNESRPVYIRGYSISTNTGHAWVLDGIKTQKQDVVERIYVYIGDPNTMPSYPFDQQEWELFYYNNYENIVDYVWCNYGWNGTDDGLYLSGIYSISNSLYDYEMQIIPNIRIDN